MIRHHSAAARICAGLLVLCAVETGSFAAKPRPNFVLMIADDMAWDDSGPYGHESIQTPNLNRLAAEGMRFDQAFLTCSSCSPSRSSIITGRYPHCTDAEQLHWPLPAEQMTFVELLRQAGYWTAAAGKWHLGDAVKDRFDVVHEADTSGFQLPTGAAGKAGQFVQHGSGAVKSGCADWVRTLRERPRDQPFFLWLAALDPHRDYELGIIDRPHRPHVVRVPPYLPDVPEVRRELALYYDEIARLDKFVGNVLDELDRQAVTDSTFVLFFSDNGRPFPRDKTTLYDSGIRTPWLVRFPMRVAKHSVCKRLVSSVDIAPTVCELAFVRPAGTFQGRSFVPLLDEPAAAIRRHVFAEKHWHDYEDQCRAVRSESFKYVRNYYNDLPGTPPADGVRSPTYRAMQHLRDRGDLRPEQQTCFTRPRPAEEFYDTSADPFELKNLVDDPEYETTLNELRNALTDWQQETGDRLPETRTADEFDREAGSPLPNRVRPRPPKKQMFGP